MLRLCLKDGGASLQPSRHIVAMTKVPEITLLNQGDRNCPQHKTGCLWRKLAKNDTSCLMGGLVRIPWNREIRCVHAQLYFGRETSGGGAVATIPITQCYFYYTISALHPSIYMCLNVQLRRRHVRGRQCTSDGSVRTSTSSDRARFTTGMPN